MIEFEMPGQRTGRLSLPSVHQLIINGTNIDESLTDSTCRVETLSVSGRQTNAYDIQTETPAGYDGEMILGRRMKAKTVSVVLKIEVDDVDIMKEKVRQLNRLLRDTRYIQFSDEEEYTYYVKFVDADPDEESTRQEIVLNFLWFDPVKYLTEQTIDYANAWTLNIASSEPVQPYIEIRFDTGIKQWSLRNTTTDMNINYSHENVSSVYRLYLEEQRITKNVTETDAMDGLNIESDMEDFTIKTGDQLVITPTPKSITIKHRGVSL